MNLLMFSGACGSVSTSCWERMVCVVSVIKFNKNESLNFLRYFIDRMLPIHRIGNGNW
jgi:hypothetical protein